MLLEPFLGKWELIPEKCNYYIGIPPSTGFYTVSLEGESTLNILMKWTDASGESFQYYYSSEVDGKMYSYENPEIADFLKTELTSPITLESFSYKNGIVTTAGIRTLKNDFMHMEQKSFDSEYGVKTNYSLYKKIN